MTPDSELLARFAQDRSEAAFAELVRRHVNLVYSAALRQVRGDRHLAEDVAQAVFTDLAHKAPALARRATLAGWLYTSARFAAAKIVRAEERRRHREQAFMAQPNDSTPEPDWDTLRPALDEAMHELKEADREAVLLRYFENRPYAEIATHCGLNENATRMRVERALEKLRSRLARRGVATATTLGAVISANAVQLAPPALTATLTAASLAAPAAGSLALWSIMNATKLKLGLGALLVIGASTALIVQHHTAQHWRAEADDWQRQMAQLRATNDNLARLAANKTNPSASPSLTDDQLADLLRLRSEVGKLRQQTNELAELLRENQKLQSQLSADNQSTNQLTVADQFKLEQLHVTDAVNTISMALKHYADAHQGEYPGSFDQLKASGDLATTNFPGNIGLDSFQFMPPGITNYQGARILLRSRINLKRPEDGQYIWVYATAGDVPSTETTAAYYGPAN